VPKLDRLSELQKRKPLGHSSCQNILFYSIALQVNHLKILDKDECFLGHPNHVAVVKYLSKSYRKMPGPHGCSHFVLVLDSRILNSRLYCTQYIFELYLQLFTKHGKASSLNLPIFPSLKLLSLITPNPFATPTGGVNHSEVTKVIRGILNGIVLIFNPEQSMVVWRKRRRNETEEIFGEMVDFFRFK
jgi:hypothetical protein